MNQVFGLWKEKHFSNLWRNHLSLRLGIILTSRAVACWKSIIQIGRDRKQAKDARAEIERKVYRQKDSFYNNLSNIGSIKKANKKSDVFN